MWHNPTHPHTSCMHALWRITSWCLGPWATEETDVAGGVVDHCWHSTKVFGSGATQIKYHDFITKGVFHHTGDTMFTWNEACYCDSSCIHQSFRVKTSGGDGSGGGAGHPPALHDDWEEPSVIQGVSLSSQDKLWQPLLFSSCLRAHSCTDRSAGCGF